MSQRDVSILHRLVQIPLHDHSVCYYPFGLRSDFRLCAASPSMSFVGGHFGCHNSPPLIQIPLHDHSVCYPFGWRSDFRLCAASRRRSILHSGPCDASIPPFCGLYDFQRHCGRKIIVHLHVTPSFPFGIS